MENQTSEVIVKEENVAEEIQYEDIEYLDDEEFVLASDNNKDLIIDTPKQEADVDPPQQGSITLANLKDALALHSENIVLASNQRKTSTSKKPKINPTTVKRRSSRIAKQDSDKTIYPTAKRSSKQINKKTPSATKRNPRKRSRSRSIKVNSTSKKARSSSRPNRSTKK
ncbi:unnamed protein product [Diamesa serratosioi]